MSSLQSASTVDEYDESDEFIRRLHVEYDESDELIVEYDVSDEFIRRLHAEYDVSFGQFIRSFYAYLRESNTSFCGSQSPELEEPSQQRAASTHDDYDEFIRRFYPKMRERKTSFLELGEPPQQRAASRPELMQIGMALAPPQQRAASRPELMQIRMALAPWRAFFRRILLQLILIMRMVDPFVILQLLMLFAFPRIWTVLRRQMLFAFPRMRTVPPPCVEQMAPNEWVLDSGAYAHRTSDLSLLLKGGDFEGIDIDPPMREHTPNVRGRGSIRTECFEFPGVLYVPEVERNVVSVAQLARDHGLITVFQPTCCHVKDKETGKIVGKGRLRNGMYILDSLHINQKQYTGGDGGESGGGRCEEADGEGSSGGRWNGGGDGEGGSRGEGRGGGGTDGGGGVSGAGSHGGDGRDGGRGGGGKDEEITEDEEMEVEETIDDEDEKGIQRRRGAYVKESSQAHRDLLGLSRFTGYIIAALYYILALFGGVSGDREGKRETTSGGCPEESSQEALFGLSRFDMTTDPTGYWRRQLPAGAFPTSTNETRLQEFLVDSGASFHVTWKQSVLFPYPQHLEKHTKPPVPCFGGVGPGRINVTRSGYLNGDNIMLDGVLLALQSRMNLVSVGQLAHQYNVDVHMGQEGVTIKRLLDGVQIGGGKMKNNHLYVLEYFQPERLYAHSAGPQAHIFGKSHFSRPSQQ